MTAALRVIEPGLAATFQDAGREGYQRFGVPISGALDPVSLCAANVIVGNSPMTAGLEILGSGLAVQVEAESVDVAIAGTAPDFAVESERVTIRVQPFRSLTARRGDILRFSPPRDGAVFYLAVEGGFDIDASLGSRSTYRRAALGGYKGRALEAGDLLPLCNASAGGRTPVLLDLKIEAPGTLRVMRGPNAEYFTEDAFAGLLAGEYTVSPASDRMGIRLRGSALKRARDGELPSQGTIAGALQVPADGQPIMLMADRQTTGGYPMIATVIGADLPAAGRLVAGMRIRFQEVSRDEALSLLRDQHEWLSTLPTLLRPAPLDALSTERLLSYNLIDGVTAGLPERGDA